MSNFWIVNKKNFFTPALILFIFSVSVLLFSVPLKDDSQLFQNGYIFSVLIFAISVFIFNYSLIQKNFHEKKNLYIVANGIIFSLIIYFATVAVKDLTLNIYPLIFITNYALANLFVLIQLGINQQIKLLKINLILCYIILAIFGIYKLQPDTLFLISNLSIRIRQITGFLFIGIEIIRLINISKVINAIFHNESV